MQPMVLEDGHDRRPRADHQARTPAATRRRRREPLTAAVAVCRLRTAVSERIPVLLPQAISGRAWSGKLTVNCYGRRLMRGLHRLTSIW
jgi:hypothetical protein